MKPKVKSGERSTSSYNQWNVAILCFGHLVKGHIGGHIKGMHLGSPYNSSVALWQD